MPLQPTPASRWITWRSVILGTLAVCLVCGFTPYNDFVVANTFFIGGYLPLVLVITFFILIVVVNGPLHRWTPRHALTSGELAVVMLMMLFSCSIPTQGLMRYFLPMLVAPFHYGASQERFWQMFTGMHLPGWLFPVPDIAEGRTSPIVRDFYNRVQEGVPIPYAAWIVPLAGWGIFLFSMMATLIALATLLRYQWAVNERLPFPLAQLQSALIEPPRPGRMLNDLLGSRLFWIGLTAIFLLQSSVALNKYFPKIVPLIPLKFNLGSVMANEPWMYFSGYVKSATLYFTFIGITYFIQSRLSFSLWCIFLLEQIISVQQKMVQSEIRDEAWRDQHLGACVAFLLGILWIGRHHWWRVLRQTVGKAKPGEARGDFGSYRGAVIVAAGGLIVMMAWLLFLGVQAWVACGIVAFILLGHLITSRVVAETGLPFARVDVTLPQIYTNLPASLLSARDVFFTGVLTASGPVSTRESLLTFSLHGLQVADGTSPPPGQRRGILLLIAWTMILGFVVAAFSSLYCYYTYATPLTPRVQSVLNPFGLESRPKSDVVDPLEKLKDGRFAAKQHGAWTNMGIGLGVTGLLQAAALRWSAWPFMPVGYLMAPTWYIQTAWFSILLGWFFKVVIVRYGGASLYVRSKPLFVGIIFGEGLAAGAWLIVTLILAWMGVDYQTIGFLPY